MGAIIYIHPECNWRGDRLISITTESALTLFSPNPRIFSSNLNKFLDLFLLDYFFQKDLPGGRTGIHPVQFAGIYTCHPGSLCDF